MNLANEIWLASRLRAHAVHVFDGLTTIEQRRTRAREGIVRLGLADTFVGHRCGKPETFGALFERIYGEHLFVNKAA